MSNQDFTLSFLVDQSPKEAFDRINEVKGWWIEEHEGRSEKQGDEFSVRFAHVHFSRQKLIEVIPEKKVVWLVTDSHLSFLEDKSEWTGTKIIFSIAEKAGKTEVSFSHEGLQPGIECFSACSNAWTDYIQNSLRLLISTGKGKPFKQEAQ